MIWHRSLSSLPYTSATGSYREDGSLGYHISSIKGLKSKDIIISINQKEIKNPKDVITAVSENGIEKKMKFKVLRNNQILFFSITPKDINNLKNLINLMKIMLKS